MSIEDIGLVFFTVLILSLLLTPISSKFAHIIGAVDHPVDRSVHVKVMPRLGGLGMAFALIAGLLLFSPSGAVFQGFIAGLVIIVFTGLADDLWDIKARWKMLGQILAAVVFLEISGAWIENFGDIFHLGEISLSQPVAYAVSVFLILSGINCFNFSDGLDGLASGIVAIICLFLAVFAISAHNLIVLLIVVALLASVLGFLKFNSFPAKLFMGDCGSLMLGYVVCTMALSLASIEVDNMIKPVTVCMILTMPIADTFWVMMKRIMQGISPARADNTHLHHRLLALGLPHPVVVTVLYVWTALFGFLALFVCDFPEYWQLGSALFLTVVLYGLLAAFEKGVFRFPSVVFFNKKDEHDGRQRLVKFMGLSMRLFPFVILVGLSLPLFFANSFAPTIGKLTLALALLVAVAFPWKEHQERSNIVYGLYYLCVFILLWVWNTASYSYLNLDIYWLSFVFLLMTWSAFKIRFKGNHEVFLTSSFELLLILISWFIPYVVLPALEAPVAIMEAAKLSCFVAIPLFIALKLTVNSQAHRNKKITIGLILLLVLIAVRALY